jgi:hypothetical protein
MSTALTWDGGRLDGTPWQGIRYLSIAFDPGGAHPATVTAHLNRPVGSLTDQDVAVRGGRRVPVPPYEVSFAGRSVTIRFRGLGDHSPYTVELTDGGGRALHPFFATAEFRFTIDCEVGDCRESPTEARRPPAQPPAVDLLTKDYNGFEGLLADWIKVRSPQVTDLSPARRSSRRPGSGTRCASMRSCSAPASMTGTPRRPSSRSTCRPPASCRRGSRSGCARRRTRCR